MGLLRISWALVAALAAPALDRPQGSLVGRWRSLETSKGGIGAVFAFHQDGSVDFSPGAVVEMPYGLEGDKLLLAPDTQNGKDSVPEQTVKFVDDNHVEVSTEQEGKIHIQELRRQGSVPDPKNLILGEWTSAREDLGARIEATEIFYRTGKLLLLIPFIWHHGQYAVAGNIIHVEVPNGPNVQGPFKVEGDTLRLPGAHGGTSQFARY